MNLLRGEFWLGFNSGFVIPRCMLVKSSCTTATLPRLQKTLKPLVRDRRAFCPAARKHLSQMYMTIPQRVCQRRAGGALEEDLEARSSQRGVPTQNVGGVRTRPLYVEQELAQRQMDCLQQVVALLEQQAPPGQALTRGQQTELIEVRRRQRLKRAHHGTQQQLHLLVAFMPIKEAAIRRVNVRRRCGCGHGDSVTAAASKKLQGEHPVDLRFVVQL